ncbi:DUF2867 domain-containing protein, partial [Xanthomonas sacchari]|uniref:DUF2867 domain-containing protein n=2 Tax=Xanthomonas TaxID=338 RepID=UPI00225DD91A
VTPQLLPGSLLEPQLPAHHHQDSVRLTVPAQALRPLGAHALMTALLDGFLQHPPRGVTWLMRLRNVLVAPLRLRTSPLGCPVSSLLSPQRDQLFAGRFPVLAQASTAQARRVQVLLGADDRYLVFRSCVGVTLRDDGSAELSLETRVACRNRFGHLYMALIAAAHRRYIAPTLLRAAAEALLLPVAEHAGPDAVAPMH